MNAVAGTFVLDTFDLYQTFEPRSQPYCVKPELYQLKFNVARPHIGQT